MITSRHFSQLADGLEHAAAGAITPAWSHAALHGLAAVAEAWPAQRRRQSEALARLRRDNRALEPRVAWLERRQSDAGGAIGSLAVALSVLGDRASGETGEAVRDLLLSLASELKTLDADIATAAGG